MKRLKHRKENSKEPIWQHPPKLWHPSNTRPRHHVLFAGKRALNQSCEKILNLPSSLCGSGNLSKLEGRVWDGSVCSRGADESVPLLSPTAAPRSARSSLPSARVRLRHFRTESPNLGYKGLQIVTSYNHQLQSKKKKNEIKTLFLVKFMFLHR